MYLTSSATKVIDPLLDPGGGVNKLLADPLLLPGAGGSSEFLRRWGSGVASLTMVTGLAKLLFLLVSSSGAKAASFAPLAATPFSSSSSGASLPGTFFFFLTTFFPSFFSGTSSSTETRYNERKLHLMQKATNYSMKGKCRI